MRELYGNSAIGNHMDEILAGIIWKRLTEHVENVLEEYQAGFKNLNWSTTDQIFFKKTPDYVL